MNGEERNMNAILVSKRTNENKEDYNKENVMLKIS